MEGKGLCTVLEIRQGKGRAVELLIAQALGVMVINTATTPSHTTTKFLDP